MAFDPSSIGITDETGKYPSQTRFISDSNTINFIGNGDPFPAKAGDPFVNDGETSRTGFGLNRAIIEQSYNITFNYRGGRNGANETIVKPGPIGVAANGVILSSFKAENKPLPKSLVHPPEDLTYNLEHFSYIFEPDRAGGYPMPDGTYSYTTGKFLPNTFSREFKVYSANDYYNNSSYGSDHMRHTNGHSKIIGFSFDGYPIYGPYGYEDPLNTVSRTVQMKSSYVPKETDAHRPNNFKYTDTILLNNEHVPLSAGSFIEDYAYFESLGTLDEYNGRFCITPEYPEGTYAYFLTFKDKGLVTPAYPYIVGPKSKQKSTAGIGLSEIQDLWNQGSQALFATLEERKKVELQLPVANNTYPRIELISGQLPPGLRIDGTKLRGTPFEVTRDIISTFVLRAYFNGIIEDKTFKIAVTGPDNPVWVTNEGQLPAGTNNAFYVLDNSLVDFQLVAIDPDIIAGDELDYFIADGDGELPPGLSMDRNGKITGIVEPLLALDQKAGLGGYDAQPYDYLLNDYSIRSSNGYASFYYDTQTYDYNIPTQLPKKLNRYYPFAVTVTDGDQFVRREFTIYLVGDDFLRADNTIMQSGDGVFTADNTYLRNPVWLTPSDLGFKRANNYVTLYLDVIDTDTLQGALNFILQDFNDDGSLSELPPGLKLDGLSGEIVGRIPYQPAITENYKFTVRAQRFDADLEQVTIFGNIYEDTLLGKNSVKIYKLPRGLEDGVDDLNELNKSSLLLGGRSYFVERVNGNNPEYDELFLSTTLSPEISLILSQEGYIGQKYIFAQRLEEAQKTRYEGRNLNFSSNESYNITRIVPYLEYTVTNRDATDLLINPDRIPVKIGQQYIIGDWVTYQNQFYQLVDTDLDEGLSPLLYHTVQPQVDADGAVITDANGDPVIDFDVSKWSLVANAPSDLTQTQAIDIVTKTLQIEIPAGADLRGISSYETNIYVTEFNIGSSVQKWRLRIPATSYSRNMANIKSFFIGNETSNLDFKIIRDNEDRLEIDNGENINTGLKRNLTSGRNIGIALFGNDTFSKTVLSGQQDEVTGQPFTDKTFDIRIIGEIDSTIQFITPSDLGSIDANYVSTLNIQATTTVPDTNLTYIIKSGKLPNGLRLNYTGEIIGRARQFVSQDGPGLTTFDDTETTFDTVRPTATTFDREYKFVVEARDRFGFSAVEQEFTLRVNDKDNLKYSNIYVKPLLKEYQRNLFRTFTSNNEIFDFDKIYRPDDPEFGIQNDIKMLIYAGIETKSIENFVAAASKNHKRKSYKIGDFKIAEAKEPGSNDVVYEAIYIDIIDPAKPTNGKARKTFTINSNNKITADSIAYAAKDDVTNKGTGFQELPVYGRQTVKFIIPQGDDLIIFTRDAAVPVDADNLDFEVEVRAGGLVSVKIPITDSEPERLRPKTNTIKADSDAIRVSDFRDQKRYLVNIDNMRDEIKKIGVDEREYLPLWMRTPQPNTFPQELDYTTAIPVCFCKPGQGKTILANIQNAVNTGVFDPRQIHFEFDRYIVDQTKNNGNEQYILFANYQFNV
jgi:hypothetical protein